jgi:hypothetical protein
MLGDFYLMSVSLGVVGLMLTGWKSWCCGGHRIGLKLVSISVHQRLKAYEKVVMVFACVSAFGRL